MINTWALASMSVSRPSPLPTTKLEVSESHSVRMVVCVGCVGQGHEVRDGQKTFPRTKKKTKTKTKAKKQRTTTRKYTYTS